MPRHSILFGLVLVSALVGGCREAPAGDAIPTGVPGSYVYAAEGAALKKLEWQFAATLDLKADGTFVLALDKTLNGEKDSTAHSSGTYTVSGDKVWLRGREEGRGRHEQHALLIKPDSLIGEIGWKTHLILRGLGAPDPVFVKRTASLSATNPR